MQIQILCTIILLPCSYGLRMPISEKPSGAAAAEANLETAHSGQCMKYYRVPRTGSTITQKALKACSSLEYLGHPQAMTDASFGKETKCQIFGNNTVLVMRDPCERFKSSYWKRVDDEGATVLMDLHEEGVTPYTKAGLITLAKQFKKEYPTMKHLIKQLQKDYPDGLPSSPPKKITSADERGTDLLNLQPMSSHNIIFWPTAWFYNKATAHPVCYSRDNLIHDLEKVTHSLGCSKSTSLWEEARHKKFNAHFPKGMTEYPKMSSEECSAVKDLYRSDIKLLEKHNCQH